MTFHDISKKSSSKQYKSGGYIIHFDTYFDSDETTVYVFKNGHELVVSFNSVESSLELARAIVQAVYEMQEPNN